MPGRPPPSIRGQTLNTSFQKQQLQHQNGVTIEVLTGPPPLRRGGFLKDDSDTSSSSSCSSSSGGAGLQPLLKAGRATGTLNLSCRQLKGVPTEVYAPSLAEDEKFWECRGLTKLDLSHNEIEALPPDLALLGATLRVLLLRHEPPVLPPSLPPLPGKPPHSRPVRQQDQGARPELTLHLSNNLLRSFPPSLGTLQKLTTLTATGNALEVVSPSLLALPSLRLLDLRKNKITETPPGRPLDLSLLPSLVLLDLRENKLKFTPVLHRHSQLSQLYLGNSRLASLPPALAPALAPSLTELDVQGNLLEELPLEIGMCIHLKLLDARNNSLRETPFVLGNMESLTRGPGIVVQDRAMRVSCTGAAVM
ncbi:leucine-rich repeat-containing protein 40-like [Nannochloropsis oceanica]